MTADVPIGSYLSGGIDSNVQPHLWQMLATKINTTMGFEGYPNDINIVAFIGTKYEHHEIFCTNEDMSYYLILLIHWMNQSVTQ